MSRQFTDLGAELPQLMAGLFERAADNLTEAELQHLKAYPEVAHNMVVRMAEVCTGIACLVQSDDPKNGGSYVGSFSEPVSSSSLLFMLADTARQADAFMTLGQRAAVELESRARLASAEVVAATRRRKAVPAGTESASNALVVGGALS